MLSLSDNIYLLLGPFILAPLVGGALALRRFLRKQGFLITHALLWSFSERSRHVVTARVNMHRYCKLCLKIPENEYLQVPSRFDTNLPLDDLFVSLRLDSSLSSGAAVSSSNILQSGTRIRVVGDPGSGKSTLVKKLFRDACKSGIESATQSRLPILVNLKSLRIPSELHETADLAQWLIDVLRSQVARIRGHEMAELFDTCLGDEGAGLLVLLDGLDEVNSKDYSKSARMIAGVSSRLAELGQANIVILTMRTQFHQSIRDSFSDTYPTVLHVQPFTKADMYEFLRRWTFKASSSEHSARNVYQELTSHTGLRDLCTNPLILSMYVADNQLAIEKSDLSSLPDTKSQFYLKITDELLVNRRSRQLNDRSAKIANRRQRQQILGRLAFENMITLEADPNSLSWTRALEITMEVARLPSLEEAELAFRDLMKEVGILSEERPGESLRFMHRTFCEFFAALEAAQLREQGWDDLFDAYLHAQESADAKTRLSEVVGFAAGLLIAPSAVARVLEDVASIADWSLLGKCFLETQLYTHPVFDTYKACRAEQLRATRVEEWGAAWLQNVHDFSMVMADSETVLKHHGHTSAQEPAAGTWFPVLIGDSRERLVKIFDAYTREEPAAAYLLAEALKLNLVLDHPRLILDAVEDPIFLAIAIDEAGKASTLQEWQAWSCIFAEAGLKRRLLATELSNLPAPANLIRADSTLRKDQKWDLAKIGIRSSRSTNGKSLYSAALGIGYSTPSRAKAEALFPLLSDLRALKAPGALRNAFVIRLLVLFLMSIQFALVQLAPKKYQNSVLEIFDNSIWGYTMIIVLLMASMGVLSSLRCAIRDFEYQRAVNLPPKTSRVVASLLHSLATSYPLGALLPVVKFVEVNRTSVEGKLSKIT